MHPNAAGPGGNRAPHVEYLALGGTIASVPSAAGATPALSAADVLARVPEVSRQVEVRTHQVRQTSSGEITLGDVLDLHQRMQALIAGGAAGIVVTQGTDTIEETGFALDLMWTAPEPIVITGAMRHAGIPGDDGPNNLTSAIRVAADPRLRELGVLVVMNEEIHSARLVRKMHTHGAAAFQSFTGALGWVCEERPVVALRPASHWTIDIPAGAVVPPVALIRVASGDDLRLLDSIIELGYRGLVIEGLGGGHVPRAALPALRRVLQRMPVVLSTRTSAGEVLSRTYDFPGSETQLLRMGLIRAGYLDGLKSRILLSLCLAAGQRRPELIDSFRQVGLGTGTVGLDGVTTPEVPAR